MTTLLLFPIAAIALTFLVVMPVFSALSLAYLRWRRSHSQWNEYASSSTYLAIVAPTLLALCWLGSAAIHESESTRFVDHCLLSHQSLHCTDALMILGFIATSFVWVLFRCKSISLSRKNVSQLAILPQTHETHILLSKLISRTKLQHLKVMVVDDAPFAAMTFGIVPKIYISRKFIEDNDDQVVLATLLHEASHVRTQDPLRLVLADVCLRLNPFGKLLRREFWLWQNAREASCDQFAIHSGASSLALAHAVVKALKFESSSSQQFGLRLSGSAPIYTKLRIALLMKEHKRKKAPSSDKYGCLVFGLMIVGLLALPHLATALSLLPIHKYVENAFLP